MVTLSLLVFFCAFLPSPHVIADPFVHSPLIARQLDPISIPTDVGTACVDTCGQFSQSMLGCDTGSVISCMCSKDMASSLRDCMQCAIGHGLTAAQATGSVNGFIDGCKQLGYPVTVPPLSNSPSSSSSASLGPDRNSGPTSSVSPPRTTAPSSTANDSAGSNENGSRGDSDSPFGIENNSSNVACGLRAGVAATLLSFVIGIINRLHLV